MITFLIGFGSVLTYLGIGLLYARSQLVQIHKDIAEYVIDRENEIGIQVALCVVLWWVIIPGRRVASWFMAPVREREERITQLRKDAEYWLETASEEIDAEKAAMGFELARTLSEQAKELESS